jgi:hypothetical protein
MKDNIEKKSITSKSYSTTNIGEWEIGFYYPTMENDDSIYIDIESVKDIVERSIETVETIDVDFMVGKDTYKKKAYLSADFIEHLKPKPLKYIARYGLKMIEANPCFDEYVDTPPQKERDALSDFDKNILKAMQFNPKKK